MFKHKIILLFIVTLTFSTSNIYSENKKAEQNKVNLDANRVAINTKFFRDLLTKNMTSDPSINWIQFGPGMSGNNKNAAWHPTDPNILFIAPNMGGAYRSVDKGNTYETILDEDAPGISTGDRGPQGLTSIDFSRQSPDYGFCTDEKNRGIFMTTDKGKTWKRQQSSISTFGNAYLSCITVDPKNENIWYVGAGRMRDMGRILFSKAKPHGSLVDANSQGKIWKSEDKGKSWKLTSKGFKKEAEIETVCVDPSESNIVYASTNYGFYKSTDAGKNWTLKSNGLDNDVLRSFALQYDKKTKKTTIYVLSNKMWKAENKTVKDSVGGIFKSTDRGESWTKAEGNIALDMRQFEKNREIRKSYYYVLAYYFGISNSEAEKRFPEMSNAITPSFNQITVDPNDPNNVYVVNMYSNASRLNFKPGSMWRTKDGGKNWFVSFRNGKNWNTGSDVKFWTERGNPTGTNVSMKYLNSWKNRDDYDRKACNFTTFNCDGTVLHTQLAKISLMSYDKGETWVDIDDVETSPNSESYIGAGNSNAPGHGFYQNLQIPNKVFCAMGENSLWITNNEKSKERPNAQAATFNRLLDDELSLSAYAINTKDTNIHYALFFRQGARGQILRSTDNGKTWAKHGTPIPVWEVKAHSGDQPVHQLCLIIDKDNPDNIYFCVPKSARNMEYVGNSETAFGIHKSTDGGKTWTEPNSGLPKSLDVARLVFDPNDNNILYAAIQGNNGGLYKSVDNGDSWTEVASTSSIAGAFGINDIHFAGDGKVYISSGYKTAEEGGLWVSDNKMKSWEKIFDYPWVNRVETAHYDSNVILISTLANSKIDFMNAGTYLSKDGGKSWIKINKGNGQSDKINDIAIDNYTPGKYYLSTYGCGLYVAKE